MLVEVAGQDAVGGVVTGGETDDAHADDPSDRVCAMIGAVNPVLERLDEATWRRRAEAHATRVDALLAGHLARRRERVPHPVHDFLFTYYSFRPSQLRRWHPGAGIACDGDGAPPLVTSDDVASKRPLLEATHRLLSATAARPASFGCFGLHEWAMVHRSAEHGTRHGSWPLRLGAEGTDEVVESHRIACSHFDAFRFFSPSARPLNTLSPGPGDRPEFEQPGCLHAGMDLYKHAFRLWPLVSSELVADCFELAWDVRVVDMRAAPYDFSGLTLDHTGEPWTPIPIETPEGKQEYVLAQRRFAERGQELRERLAAACGELVAGADQA